MKRFSPVYLFALLFLSSLSSCRLVEGIFKAGMYTGIIVVVLVVALVIWLLRKIGGRR
jgi:cytosine/uracil/thiamine/allantoin permease